jgi:hypothetical protein
MLTIGCDPEVFVRDLDSFVSAHGMSKGTKQEPVPLGCGAVQVDGTALEFNIPPAKTCKEFMDSVLEMRGELDKLVKTFDPNYIIAATPTATFDKDYFERQIPEENKLLGCDPDYDAWTGYPNQKPETDEPMRTGSGHIHLGIFPHDYKADPRNPLHFEACRTLVKQLDCALYFPSLLWDRDRKRRALYGNIGAFRPKPYGVEYRVLSNAWLNDIRLVRWVYVATETAFTMLKSGVRLFEDNELLDFLNNDDHDHAATYAYVHLLDRYEFPCLPDKYVEDN